MVSHRADRVLGTEEEVAASGAPVLAPWRTVLLDPECGGTWVVAGDIDGDGEVEIVSAQNHNDGDVHYTSAVAAQKLDGRVLWRWGDPTVGRRGLHHDVACQIHDWDGDGRAEVVLLTEGYLVHLEGPTGRELRRLPIPHQAWDCLTFADLRGTGRPTDVLVKTRYSQLWALSYEGSLLWTAEHPGGYPTAHQAQPIDIDGDGRDEVMAGYALLNQDGTVRWVFESHVVDLRARGHLDAMRVLYRGETAAEYRLALTCCGANNLAVVDGEGRTVWEVRGHHFESMDIGHFCPDVPGPQIAVDIDHVPWAQSPVWVFSATGEKVAEMTTVYSRSHRLIDWLGGPVDVLAIGRPHGLFDCAGRRLASFDLRLPDGTVDDAAGTVAVGDMTGNGVADLMVNSERAVFVYANPLGRASDMPLGSGRNVTYY